MSEPEDLRGAVESRLLAVERDCNAIDRDLRKLMREVIDLQQHIWDEDTHLRHGGTPTPTPTPTPNTTVQGTVIGCNSTGVSGQTVTVYDNLGGVLGTATSGTAGAYTTTFYLGSSIAGSVVVTPSSARNASTTVSVTITSGSSTTKNVTMNVGTGYACFVNCSRPIAQSLTLTSTGTCNLIAYPNDTLVYQSTSPSYLSSLGLTGACWLGTAAITVPAGTFAPAGTDYVYYLSATGGGLYVVSPDANSGLPVARDIIGTGTGNVTPSSCAPMTYSQTCVLGGNRWGGTLAE